ncbi:MAG: hypothetical protein GXY23_16010 [Myxococcales bacterium]|nr:hypothetical protein [Myxococcales bacterium]
MIRPAILVLAGLLGFGLSWNGLLRASMSSLGLEGPAPATQAAERILERIRSIEQTVVQTKYQHRTVVDPRRGLYQFDCSGLVTWVLEQEAPISRKYTYAPRPTARDYVEAIERAPTQGTRGGWQRIAHVADAQAGDIFAWTRPRHFPSDELTGHTGFILRAPKRVPILGNVYSVRIADSTSVPHQDDTREPGSGGGFGRGTILIGADEWGKPISYGWFGVRYPALVEAPVRIGRVHR